MSSLYSLHLGRYTRRGLPKWVHALIKKYREETRASLSEACRAVAALLRDLP